MNRITYVICALAILLSACTSTGLRGTISVQFEQQAQANED